MFLRMMVVFAVLILAGCGGSGGGSNIPEERPASSISGTAFDGLILGGNISVYAYDGGTRGELLGSGTTDDSGLYSVSIISADRPVLIEVAGGRYIEEASGSNVALNDDDRLTGVAYYVSGQPITISITYFTHLATGLAEYLVSTGSDVKTAIELANSRISDLLGIDITSTTPLDVTLLSSATSQPTPGHLYGMATAAISQYMKFISEANSSPVHSVYKSIAFARLAYEDIRADGRLNGQGDSGLLSLGTVAVTPETYRNTLATNMFVMASSDRNRTGLTSADVLNTVITLNNADDAIFGGAMPIALGDTAPQISNLSITEGQTVWQTVNVSADITDIAGIDSVELRLDDVLLRTFAAGEVVDYAIDTTTYSDDAHKVSFIATNIFNGVSRVDINLTFFNGQTVISNIAPPDGAYLSGLFTMTAGVGDPLGVSEVQFSMDGTPFTLSVDRLSPSALIASGNYEDGSHIVEIQATNNAEFITAESVTYIFDNTDPGVSFVGLQNLDVLSGIESVQISVTDNLGLARSEVFLSGVSVYASSATESGTQTFFFDTTLHDEGPQTLTANVQDKAGNTSSSSLNIFIDQTPSNLVITAPVEGAMIAGAFTVSVIVSENLGVASVEFFLDGASLGFAADITNPTKNVAGNLLSDGAHTVMVIMTDSAGRTTSETINITIDNTAPSADFSGIANGDFLEGSMTLNFTAADAALLARVEIRLNDEVIAIITNFDRLDYVFDTTTYTEGAYTLSVTAIDAAGNSASSSYNITIDQAPPTVVITNPTSGSALSNDFTIRATATDTQGIQSVEFELDGTSLGMAADVNSPQMPVAISGQADGAHTVAVIATDTSGRTTTQTVNFTVDKTAPATSITNIAEGGVLAGTNVLTFTASDNLVLDRVELRIDSTLLSSFTTFGALNFALDTTAYTEGAHTLSVTATDTAGNSATNTYNIIIDQTPPAAAITNPPAGVALNSDFVIRATASDSLGIASVELFLDGTSLGLVPDVSNPQQAVAISGLIQGAHTATVIATDTSGRTTTQTVNFTVDTQTPTTSITNVTNGDVLAGSVTLDLAASDSLILNSVVLSLDSSVLASFTTFGALTHTLNTTAYTEGAHTLSVTATDTAGNSATSSYNVIIDQAAPTLSITNPLAGDIISGDFTLRAEVSDTNDVASVEVLLNGDHYAWASTIAPQILISSNNACTLNGTCINGGPVTITLRATDVAGKVTERSVDVVFDNSAPVISLTAGSCTTTNSDGSGTISFSVTINATDPETSIVSHAASCAAGPGLCGLVGSIAVSSNGSVGGVSATAAVNGVETRTFNYSATNAAGFTQTTTRTIRLNPQTSTRASCTLL